MQTLPNELVEEILSYCDGSITKQVCWNFYECSPKVNIFSTVEYLIKTKQFSLLPLLIRENNKELLYDKLNHFVRWAEFSIIEWVYNLGCCVFEDTLELAVKRKDGKILSFLEKRIPHNTKSLNALLEIGDLENFLLLLSNNCPIDSTTITYLAGYGYLDLLVSKLPPICVSNKPLEAAIKNGHREVVRFLLFKGHYIPSSLPEVLSLDMEFSKDLPIKWSNVTCARVAERGDLETLKWLRTRFCPWDEVTCSMAALNGHLHVVKWAHKHGCRWGAATCANAALNGHLDILIWARRKGCPWNESVYAYAALNAHFNIILWAKENGCPWDESLCINAARKGHDFIIHWAIDNNCPIDNATSVFLASKGKIELLRILRNKGCIFTAQTAKSAVGHPEVFKELIEMGCPFNYGVWEEIVRKGNLSLLLWLEKKEKPFCSIVDFAAKHGQLSILRKFLVKPGNYTCAYAAGNGHLAILKYFYLQGFRFNSHASTYAARSGRLDILSWLKEHGCPMKKGACASAAKEGHLHILVWLREKGCSIDQRTYDFAKKYQRWNVLDWLEIQGKKDVRVSKELK